jgi:hypothetical protein
VERGCTDPARRVELGLAGERPLSKASTGNERFQVEYFRFVRHGAPTQLNILVSHRAGTGDQVRIAFDRRYINGLSLDSIVPEPDSLEAIPDWFVYVFRVSRGSRASTVTFKRDPPGGWSSVSQGRAG